MAKKTESKAIPVESNHDVFIRVICSFDGNKHSEMLGVQFYYKTMGEYIACDNSEGKADTNYFDTLEECLKWFENHESYDENADMLLGEYLMNRD